MLMITALIRPFSLDRVKTELLSAGLAGLTVSDCVGYGRNPVLVPSLIAGFDIPDILPKVKIEIVVPSDKRRDAIDAIIRGARLGKIGDGKIFISEIEKVFSVCTGEEDDEALRVIKTPAEAAE